MEKGGENNVKKMAFVRVWLEKLKEGKLIGFGCFLSEPTKNILLERKRRKNWIKKPMCRSEERRVGKEC